LEANQAFTLTYTGISSSTLGDTDSGKMGKKRQRRGSSNRNNLEDVLLPHEQETEEDMLDFLEPTAQPVEPITHHNRGNKRRNGTLKYKKKHLA